jgi:glycosyltransferase 2 family protein
MKAMSAGVLTTTSAGHYADLFMRASSRKLLLVLLGACVLAFVIYRSSASFQLGDFSGAKLLRAVRQANLFYLFLSLIGIYVCYAVRSLRWQVFQRNLGPSSFWTIYQITLAGFCSLFLLGRAGEPVRPLLLARKEKLPVADMFGIYVLERLFDTASTAVIAACGLLVFNASGRVNESTVAFARAARTTGVALALGVLVAVAFLVYLRLHGTAVLERKLHAWLAAQGWRARIARIVLGFAHGVQTIRTWGDLARAVFYSAAHWFLVLAIYVLIAHSFGGKLATLGLGDGLLVLAFAMVGSTVQLPGVGGGSQLASFLAFTAIFGVEKEPAAAAAIVIWLITFAASSLAGVPLLIREGWSLGELRRMAERENETIDKDVALESKAAVPPGESAE